MSTVSNLKTCYSHECCSLGATQSDTILVSLILCCSVPTGKRCAVARPIITTVRDHLAWSYANLAAAHAAVESKAGKYERLHFIIRTRLYHGLVNGTMNWGTLYDDEKVKYQYPTSCSYCGTVTHLTLDHLIPRLKGGSDEGDNLVWACKTCNSSKGGKDVLDWLSLKERRPSVLLLRRYLKLVARYCSENNLMDVPLSDAVQLQLPFRLSSLPYKLDNPERLELWVAPLPD